jgi:hypothetical protein
MRWRASLGPKTLISRVFAKEKLGKSLEFPWKKLGKVCGSLDFLGELAKRALARGRR